MTTRRKFIGTALAVGAATMSAAVIAPSVRSAPAPGAGRATYLPLERVLFDVRFDASAPFAAAARSRSAKTSAIENAVHDLWYADLYHHWRDRRAPIAGLTDFRTLFLLEMMAADAGLHVVHRIHHHWTGTTYRHDVFGPLAHRAELADRMAGAHDAWAQEAAGIVTSWPNHLTAPDARRSDILLAKRQEVDLQTPISWIIG